MKRAALSLAFGVLAGAPAAHAQTTGAPASTTGLGIDAQTYRPAVDSYGIFSVERTRTSKQFDFGFKLGVDYTDKPLRLRLTDATGRAGEQDVISSFTTVHFQGHAGLTDWLQLALDVPLSRIDVGPGFGDKEQRSLLFGQMPRQNVGPSNAGPGDLRVSAKARMFGSEKVGVAGMVTATLPFGDEDAFSGSASFTYEPKLVADFTSGAFSAAINAGARIHQERDLVIDPGPSGATMPGSTVIAGSHEVILAGGLMYRVNPFIGLAAEYFRAQAVGGASGQDGDSTNDVLAGVQVYPASDLSISVAGGTGFGDAARKDAFRVLVGLAWSPEGEAGATGADRDGDDVADDKDLCPDEPEDKDQFEDQDGCPDPDNDRDGLVDKQDKCVAEAEDKDGFQDDDGCPDVDNDGDEIPDVSDKCPNEAEDKDGFQDDDGCPDRDNDGDGLPDDQDKCPGEPETKNGIDDEDGCPDGGVTGRLDSISDRVQFPAGKVNLDAGAQRTLDRIAEQLRAFPEVTVRIEGHADPVGASGKQEALSAARADAVREYLVRKGVNPNRLSAVGYGGKRPLVKSGPRVERAKNDRVEFIVTRSGQ